MRYKSKTEAEVAALPKQKVYFGKEVEEAIIKYNSLTNDDERNQLYETQIHPAFLKLCEYALNCNRFPYITEDWDIIKTDTLGHLIKSLYRFTPDKGKAYSYFGTAAMNYLIQWNQRSYEQSLRGLSIEELRSQSNNEDQKGDDFKIEMAVPSNHSQTETQELLKYVVDWFKKNNERLFQKKDHQACCLDVCKALTVAEADWFDDMYYHYNHKSQFTGLQSFVQSMYKKHDPVVYTRVIWKLRYYYKLLKQDFLNDKQSFLLHSDGGLALRDRKKDWYIRKKRKERTAKLTTPV